VKLFNESSSAYPQRHLPNVNAEEQWLSDKCVILPDGHWLIRQNNGIWMEIKNDHAAFLSMVQNWAGAWPQDGISVIKDDDIKKYMKDEPPVVSGTIKVPTSAAAVIEYRGNTFVNSWVNSIMLPDAAAINDLNLRQPITLLMRMIRESLCNRPGVKTLDEMLATAMGDDPAEMEFRFVMNFLAAPIQHPGINLQVNLWLLGEMNGTGKGTLDTLMSKIYGSDNALLLNMPDIEKRGWTDSLNGKLWISLNEFAATKKFDWNTFFKQHTCDSEMRLATRYSGTSHVMNFGNWVILSNKERPDCIDPHDRRNALVATTSDRTIAELSLQLQKWMADHPEHIDRLLGGFVWILHNHRVDFKMLDRAPDTLLKTEAQEATADDDWLYFLLDDDDYPRDRWQRSKDWLSDFRRHGSDPALRTTPKMAGLELSRLARKGHIQVRYRDIRNKPNEYLVERSKFPLSTDIEHPKNATLLGLFAKTPTEEV
jgi:hypothetical protein